MSSKDSQQPKKGKARDLAESLIVAIILALIVKTFAVQTFQIPSGSMEDGLLVGDHIIVNKMIYGEALPILGDLFPIREPERGDVIIFKYPPEPTVDYIKRVIGMPGEKVTIYQHQVYIDGVPVEELGLNEDEYTFQWKNADTERAEAIGAMPYDPAGREASREAERRQEYTVPEGHYFVMGDHRSNSRDSRVWGMVPRENVVGRGVLIYWSYDADREAYQETNPVNQVVNLVKSIVSFPVKTRWGRLFNVIN